MTRQTRNAGRHHTELFKVVRKVRHVDDKTLMVPKSRVILGLRA
jgi:hypothetical protein